MNVVTIPRHEFLTVFATAPGEHVTTIAPTGGGKTTLITQCLAHQDDSQLTVIIDPKPRNPELDRHIRGQGFRTVSVFPPTSPGLRLNRERRWRVRYSHTGDPATDDARFYDLVAPLFTWCYNNAHKYGGVRLVLDEVYDIVRNRTGGVRKALPSFAEMILTHGRSQQCGLWGGSQRPRKIPLEFYSQASHIFLGPTPAEDDRKRYGEISGIVDPKGISTVVSTLDKYWFLYLRRAPVAGCLVTP